MAKKKKNRGSSGALPIVLALLGVAICVVSIGLGGLGIYLVKPEWLPKGKAVAAIEEPKKGPPEEYRQPLLLKAHMQKVIAEVRGGNRTMVMEMTKVPKSWFIENYGETLGAELYDAHQPRINIDGPSWVDQINLGLRGGLDGRSTNGEFVIVPATLFGGFGAEKGVKMAKNKLSLFQLEFRVANGWNTIIGPIMYADDGFHFYPGNAFLKYDPTYRPKK